MQKRLLFFIIVALIGLKSNAQKNVLADYKHTINFADHKITFQLPELGEERKFTDPQTKYYWYSANQIKTTQGGYSGRLLHGIYCDYYLNNNLKEQGKFDLGLKTGEWKNWDERGTLISKDNFSEGILSGSFFKYDTTGNLAAKGTYKNGLIHGKFTKVISRDSVQVTRYKNGVVKLTEPKIPWFEKLFFWQRKERKG